MKKSILNLGKVLNKSEQKIINGGTSFVAKCCSSVFGCTYVRTHSYANLLQAKGYTCIALYEVGEPTPYGSGLGEPI